MVKLISQSKGNDVQGNRITIVQVESELKKMELYNYLEQKYPNKDFYVDWFNPRNTEDNMFQIVFAGSVKVTI